MGYEPTVKVQRAFDAMDARGKESVWASIEISAVMEVPQSQVPSYFLSAMKHQLVFRRVGPGGRLQWSRTRFPEDMGAAPEVDAVAHDPEPLEIPTFRRTVYVPAPMTAPRAGSDVRQPKFAEGTRPAPAAGHSCPPAAPSAAPAEELAPQAEPTMADNIREHIREHAAFVGELQESGVLGSSDDPLAEEVDEEVVDFDYCLWRDGGVQVWGVEQLADGSFKISMEQLIDMREAFELAAGRHAREQAA